MSTEEFVKAFFTEKEQFLKEYLSENPESHVGQLIGSMELSDQKKVVLKEVLDASFTDIFYTILLGLDGCAPIGGVQEVYELKDEKGNQLSGEIEEFAHKYFQEGH